MTRPIEHIATVVRAGDGVVEVELTAQSACASCHARMACGMGESTRKRIEIATPEAPSFTAGERVTVSVVPCVVLVGALVAASLAGSGDGAAALSAVGGIALYYGALYLLRERLEKKIHFKIHKQ